MGLGKQEKRLIEKVRHTIGKTISKYNLIENGDKILVGISGGKDSLILLETLAARKQYIPIDYTLLAVHIKVRNISYEVNKEWLQKFCDNLGVEFLYKEVDFEKQNFEKTPCFFCSWTRRKQLFNLSKELGYNKIATGHHLDDALETLLMNMVYHGSISSLPPSFEMFEGRIRFIRPMIEVFEDQLVEYSQIKEYPKLKSECPHDSDTQRKAIRGIIENLQTMNPQAKINMFRSMGKINEEYLIR